MPLMQTDTAHELQQHHSQLAFGDWRDESTCEAKLQERCSVEHPSTV